MAALLDQESVAYRDLRRGEIIEGTVVGTDRDGILVDVGAKSEGVIPPNEMHCLQPEGPSKLSIGDKVLVSVVQPESHEGQVILSLDRARGERGWRVLQDYLDNNEAFEGFVTGSNKGGLLVNVEGVNAFVPLSQIVAGPERGNPDATQRALGEWVGKNITLKVIELNRRRNRAILSERSAVQEKRAAEKERLLQELEEGDVKTGRITSIRDFGVFVDIGGADGLVHLSELSWERTPKSPHELFHVGDEVPVYVLKVDNEAKKIALSVRRAQPERWEEIVSRYREGQIVPGQVTKLAPFGAFVRLEGPIEGLIHISELVDRRITHPREVVEESDVLPVKIVRIEYDRHRLGLSLKQARDRAEEEGWVFNAQGGTLKAPRESLDKLGLAAMPQRPQPSEDGEGAEGVIPEETVSAADQPETAGEASDGAAATVSQDVTEEAAAEATEAAAPEAEEVAEPAAEVEAPTAGEVEEPTAEAEAPAVEEVTEPVAEAEVSEPAAEEVEEPTAEAEAPAAEEVTEPVAEAEAPATDEDTEGTAEAPAPEDEVAEPVAEEVSEPAAEEVEEPVVNEVSEPVAEEAAEPTDKVEAPAAEAEETAADEESSSAVDEAPAETAEAPEAETAEEEAPEPETAEEPAPESEAEAVTNEDEAAVEAAEESAEEPAAETVAEEVPESMAEDVTESTPDAFNKLEDE
jgi:small subunit ribosomal protein S1